MALRIFTDHTVKQFFRDYDVYPKEMLKYIMRVSPLRQTEMEFADVGQEHETATTFRKTAYCGYYLEIPDFLMRHYRQEGLWVPSEMYLQPDHTGQVCFYRHYDKDGRRFYGMKERGTE